MRRAQKKKWYAAGLRFECARCGKCCGGKPGYVWVTKDDILRVRKSLNLTEEEFHKKYLRRVGWRLSLAERSDGRCVFLEGKGCSVYEVRPAQCRAYPFWKYVLKSERAWLKNAQSCLGTNRGIYYTAEEIEEMSKMSPI